MGALILLSSVSTGLATAPGLALAKGAATAVTSAPPLEVVDSTAPIIINGSKPSSGISPFVKFETVDMIPKSYFDEHRSLYGLTERVLDGDTIRVSHVPDFALTRQAPPPLQKRGLADETLKIRFYGVDCPEIAKTKNQVTQAFGDEAKQFTTDSTYHKMVQITLLRRDRYGRAIAVVETLPSPGFLATGVGGPKDMTVELARQGLAELYEGGGAEYYVRT